MELATNEKFLNHNLRSDDILQKKEVSTLKTSEGGNEYIINSNEKTLLPSLDRGGSFSPNPQSMAMNNVNREIKSNILNKNNGALKRNFRFL